MSLVRRDWPDRVWPDEVPHDRDWQDKLPHARLTGCVVVVHKAPPAAPIPRGEWRRLKPQPSSRLIEAIPRLWNSRLRVIVAASCLIAVAVGASAVIIWLPPKPVPPAIVVSNAPAADAPLAPAPPALNVTPEAKVSARRVDR